ncbi:palmitoyltransferase ZDHHC22-like [Babylonia areolata]|uniref:palmitoyltransferase ZDHHC22-like n=1 Tax=Babylonia areolata TaxID=304850 RepID=UPI003FD27DA6
MLLPSVVERWLYRTPLGDRLAMSVFFFGGLFLLWYELSYVPAYHDASWSGTYVLHAIISLYLSINIYGNWFQVFLKESTWTGRDEETKHAEEMVGWQFCSCCSVYRPPRCHHCSVCRACVLRHDHHCWFAGACIGSTNQRHFFAMCVHMALAAIYCNVYNWSLVRSVFKEVDASTVFSLLIPHVTALAGKETWFSFWFKSVTMTGFSLAAVFAWLLWRQLSQLIGGQTRFERRKRMRDYDRGWRRNVGEVLGGRMFWVLLWPWLTSPLRDLDLPLYYSPASKCL